MESNDYLQQVVAEQAQVENALRVQRPLTPALAGGSTAYRDRLQRAVEDDEAATPAGPAIDVRVTGFWRWKTVIVPPNVYVVHTRRGHAEPLHLGLGVSFSYNPASDAFLVIPAAVQTLLISARCISAERQGVLVQAYVQWVVDDLRTAYRKLDFSDPADPMRIVNLQLREQAEAAIKDKVATMPIDAILSDKQPIIEELTHRLRAVAEGTRDGTSTTGLGLKIVTVQIKEAVVSSTRLWENLQKPFRAEREKLARLAELEAQQAVARLELDNRQARETAELETTRRLDELRAAAQREAYDRDQVERARRHRLEQEAEQQALAERAATEKARRQADEELAVQQHQLAALGVAREQEALGRQADLERARAELERLRMTASIERDNLGHQARASREERDIELFGARRTAENEVSETHLKAQLIARLPEVAAAMPRPEELRAITVGGEGAAALTGLLAGLLGLVEGLAHRNGAGG
jgi:hypothetical protein